MVGRGNLPFTGRICAALVACALVLLGLAATASAATGGAAPPGGAKQYGCPVLPASFTNAAGPAGFTMLIRVNNQENVDTYKTSNASGGLANHIRPQDIFVINTRFQNTTGTSNPTVAAGLASQLRAAFPCNRIIALNGLGSDPSQPGYVYALANEAAYAVMLDWEQDDWNLARATNPAMPPWTLSYFPNLKRIGAWTLGLSSALASTPNGIYSRAGLVPQDVGTWNYGQIAQSLDRSNLRLGSRHAGPQSVQTQASCMQGGASYGARVKQLMDSYRFRIKIKKKKVRKGRRIIKKKVRRRVKVKKKKRPNLFNLAVQISFSDTPNPADPLPIRNVSPETADSCLLAGLARGASTFFFFASDDSMRLLFGQPTMASLRPAA